MSIIQVSRGLQKGGKLHPEAFVQYGDAYQDYLKKVWLASLDNGEQTALEALRRHRTTKTSFPVSDNGSSDARTTIFMKDKKPLYTREGSVAAYEQADERFEFASKMIQKSAKDFAKAAPGVTTNLGFNFIDLRGPALMLAPINVPFRNSLARVGRQNDGYGTAPIWKASRNLGQNYAGVSEGQRNATRTPDQITYTMPYKQLGGESAVTTSAEWASEGYSPQLADEHVRSLLSFFLSEEAMDLHGNAGASAGGYALGTAATPTIVRNTVSTGGFTGSTSVSVCVVYLTAMGNPNNPTNPQYGYLNNLVIGGNTLTGGLVNSVIRTNADLSQDVIPGGISGVSAMSTVVTCDGTHQTATATAWTGTGYPKGVFGYAWYVNVTDASTPSRSNAFLYAITQFPTVTITAAPTGSQNAGQLLVGGSPVDNSFNPLDYTGLLGYAAATPGAYWNDLAGGGFTPDKTGGIVEIDVMLQYLYDNFQTNVNAFWVSTDVGKAIDHATRWGGTNGQPFQFLFTRDQQNNIMGGFVVSTYQSRFAAANPLGGEQIPIMIHPMMPKGTLYADIANLPAGYESSRLPYMRAILTRQDYHSYEWPMVTRTWTFGTYAEQMLQHMMPWASGVITGINGYTQN